MLRLFKYSNCSEYKDFPNDLFKRHDMEIKLDFDKGQAVIDNEIFNLSGILHIKGTGSKANSIETNLFIMLKYKLKHSFKNLLFC